MKPYLVALTALVFASAAHADLEHVRAKGLHLKKAQVTAVHADKNGANKDLDVLVDPPQGCLNSCSPECVAWANRMLTFCNGGGGGGVNPPQACIATMSSFFGGRRNTSGDQDRIDTVAYCASGASAECATGAKGYTSRRRSSTGDDDITDAANFCRQGGLVQCLDATYPELSRRTGTTLDQDVNDSLRVCTGG